MEFNKARVRRHRIIGPIPQHREERHWTIASIAIAAIGIGLSAYTASEAAAQQRQQAKAQQKQLNQQAQSEREQAEYEERQARRRSRLLLGRQAAEIAALELDPSMGSPLLLQLDSSKQAELDALNIRRIGARAASTSEFEASMERRRASFARASGGLGMASGAVGGAGSILREFVNNRGPGGGGGTTSIVKATGPFGYGG